ncbi:Kti12p [Cyberlindnera jadinii NRRL Y-1542]|uniref:Protein KTI12 n=1 Tax=Cyberlindnera jadinii (strain ATCC 18201 / CBS 1600 / BCRC 20928 / JCM 3617 / NBRC 0987 / NRRL Y-1542) TaxID=983966 RepID=A0A1E4S2A7_CYBJN|nr:protein KTI12 [Cyberlindnera jadinii NRRL Y-1542]ODV73600.1 protein KTI12 [Cyberlindnera jadinii NRRL Y-1542]
MPLVIFSGLPSCGKSGRANELRRLLEERIASLEGGEPGFNYKVVLHSDESLGIAKEQYRESVTEKSLRGLQISAVKRDLSRTTIVILDSPAYIKGFRYQLHCEAKALSTPCCVVHVMASVEKCLEWNSKRSQDDQWDPELLKQLSMRFEEPDGQSRWDSPLIPIAFDDEGVPFEDIWNALVLKKAPQANAATMLKPATATNYLQELDKKTQGVILKVIEFADMNTGRVKIEEDTFVDIPTQGVSNAQLQRLRRTFVMLNKVRSLDVDRIVPLFVDYLNSNLNRD